MWMEMEMGMEVGPCWHETNCGGRSVGRSDGRMTWFG